MRPEKRTAFRTWPLLIGIFCLVLLAFPGQANARPLRNGDIIFDPTKFAQYMMETGQQIVKMVEKGVEYAQSTALWKMTKMALDKGFDLFDDANDLAANVDSFNTKVNANLEMTLAEDKSQTDTLDTMTQIEADKVKETAEPPATDQYLCNMLTARSVEPHMRDFANMVAAIVKNGHRVIYRGPGDDGTGPQFTWDAMNLRAGRGELTKVPTFNPLDDPPLEWLAPSSDDVDIDIDFGTLSRYIFKLPKGEATTKIINGAPVNILEMKPEGEAEIRWIKAYQYCLNLGGPRPSIPVSTRRTDSYMQKDAKFKSCLSRQEVFIDQCAQRLGMLTRPNCDTEDEGMTALCQIAKDGCAAATDAGLDLPPNFGDCGDGLSLFEIVYLDDKLCGAPRRGQSHTLSGANSSSISDTLYFCEELGGFLKNLVNQIDQDFLRALRGLSTVDECYAAIGP
ncbi:MAG: hypothetical protein FWF24_00640 [Alphaproteobacteria bacterium]|nr:hypothetical protein [Alphaproteobacteria bacterium]